MIFAIAHTITLVETNKKTTAKKKKQRKKWQISEKMKKDEKKRKKKTSSGLSDQGNWPRPLVSSLLILNRSGFWTSSNHDSTAVTTGNDVKNITIDYNMFLFNPFLANVPILYPLETFGFLVFLRAQNVKFRQKWINGENTGLTHLFPMHPFSTPWKHFQWVEKECIENKWVNNVLKTGVITNLSYIYYDGVFCESS